MKNRATLKPKDSRPWRDSYYHKLFGSKAAHRVELVLPIFETERPADHRPRKAVDAVKAWSEGKRKLGMREVRELSLSAHAAARDVESEAAKFVAHAAGHAVGTWHVPTHALGAFEYTGRAFIARLAHPKPERNGREKFHPTSVRAKRQLLKSVKSKGNSARLDLEEALGALSSMTRKIEKAQEHFAPGTSQHTLARNRLKALRVASELITKALRPRLRGKVDLSPEPRYLVQRPHTQPEVAMEMKRVRFASVDEYIRDQPAEIRPLLEKLHQTIKKAAPKAEEAIAYGMPAFKLNGPLVYFAAFKNHIGFFPTSSPLPVFKKELSVYPTSKGTIRFPLDRPLPFGLVSRIVRFRVRENAGRGGS